MSRPIILVLGDQLFEGLPNLPSDVPVLMAETRELATSVRHHQQKLVLFFSAMRHFANGLNREAHYRTLSNQSHLDHLVKLGATEVFTYEISDSPYRLHLQRELASRGMALREHASPGFVLSRSGWADYSAACRKPKMADFYRLQRLSFNILVEGRQPVGGQWSFDYENRKSIPKGLLAPRIEWVEPDQITQEVIELVKPEFPDHHGDATQFRYPVTHAQAARWLDQFFQERFAGFGPYEDAISRDELVLWHSLLSPLLNIGLLTPQLVVARALAFAKRENIPLASLEGFLRQVIGWREFIRGIDREYRERALSFESPFGNRRLLGPSWWNATTGLPPLDASIRRCLDHGYCHHIERLMVLGSAMLMSEVHPLEAYQWFMEMFVDSADWVMGPNVYGMSQFADGGFFATKPYFSGSAYLLKMSDYPKGEWCDVWDGLYWRFIANNREQLGRIPRLNAMLMGVERLAPGRRDRIFAAAEAFTERVTIPPKEIHSRA